MAKNDWDAEWKRREARFKTIDGGRSDDAQKPPKPLIWFDEIDPVLDVLDFVQGVLMEGSSAVVYGASNSGKTFLVTDLGCRVAAGLLWFGRRVEAGGVIYLPLEGGVGFRNRIAAWKAEHGLQGQPIPFAATTEAFSIRDEADVTRLIALVKQAALEINGPVKLIIIDTLSRAMAGGNENDSVDMGTLVTCMDRLKAETGATVLFIHHCGKDAAKGARGHSLLQAAIDTEIEVIADDATGARVATVVKQREMRKGDEFPFSLRVVELGVNRHGEPVTTCIVQAGDEHTAGAVPVRRRQTGHNKRALEILADLVATAGQEGHPGVPPGLMSVPEKWWRERFYDRAMPDADDETKRKAFRRAADALVNDHVVGVANKRVWLVFGRQDAPSEHGT